MLLGQGRGKLKWRVIYELDEKGEPKVFSELMTKRGAKDYCLIFKGLFIKNFDTKESIIKVIIKKVKKVLKDYKELLGV